MSDATPADLLSVLLVGEASLQHGRHWAKINLQKTLFLTELNQLRRKLPAPSYRFYRYKQGPYSRELEESRIHLAGLGWLESKVPQPTAQASKIIRSLLPTIQALHETAFSSLWSYALEVSRYDTRELGERIYNLELKADDWPGHRSMKLRDIPQLELLIDPRQLASKTLGQTIAPAVQAGFELLFSLRPEEVGDLGVVTKHSTSAIGSLLKI